MRIHDAFAYRGNTELPHPPQPIRSLRSLIPRTGSATALAGLTAHVVRRSLFEVLASSHLARAVARARATARLIPKFVEGVL